MTSKEINLKRILFIGTVIVTAFTHSLGQWQEPPLEKGKLEDLKGATKLYVGTEYGDVWFLRKVVTTIRKEIPQLTFVPLPEDADMWFLISQPGLTATARIADGFPPVNAKPERRDGTGRSSQMRWRIIGNKVPAHPRLVKEVSKNWHDLTSDGWKDPAETLAQRFVEVYRRAGSDRHETTRIQSVVTTPPRLNKGRTSGEPAPQPATSSMSGEPEEVAAEDVIRVNTSLVTIHATVTGRDGKPTTTLRQEDFSIYEDGVKQDLAVFEPIDRPFTVVLLIDVSLSVKPQLQAITQAAKMLIKSLRPDDELVVITFDYQTREVLRLTKVRDLGHREIVISPGGGTFLYDAVNFIIARYLRRLPGRKAVVMLTDGIDGLVSSGFDAGSFMATSESNVRDAEELDALFYAVQYNTGVVPINHSTIATKEEEQRRFWEESGRAYLKSLTEKTAGHLYRADIGDLAPAFASIVEELSRQYTLGYYPRRPPQAGERRLIKVSIKAPELIVHARGSYISKAPASAK